MQSNAPAAYHPPTCYRILCMSPSSYLTSSSPSTCICTFSRLFSFRYNQGGCTRSECVATYRTCYSDHASCPWPKCACASFRPLLTRTLDGLVLSFITPDVRAHPHLSARLTALAVLFVHLQQPPLVIVIFDVDSSSHVISLRRSVSRSFS